ncbi:MAG: alpha/beta hydrolase [Mucilaginibacter sp.]
MNKVTFLVISLLFTVSVFAQAEPANYSVAANKFKELYNSDKIDDIYGMFSAEMKTALPANQFKTTTAQLKAQLGSLLAVDLVKYEAPLAVYKAKFQASTFLLNISLNNSSQFTGLLLSPYQEPRTAIDDPSIVETPVSVKILSGLISGTLAMPKAATGKVPVVIIIPGSGATDRDGNNVKANLNTNAYKMIAAGLGKNGIASLRYDKRMVGESVTSVKEENMHFDDYIDDVYSLISYLSADQRFSKIILMGHSEGSLVGILAATNENVKGFISIAGAGVPADQILTEQMKAQPQYLADEFKVVLDSLRRGKIDKKVDLTLYSIARPSIQPYLMSWCRFDPAREIKALKIPILIIQGTTDLQVNESNAEKLKKSKTTELLIIPGMNHILKEAPADREKNMATYTQPDLPLKPELVPAMVEFINKIK